MCILTPLSSRASSMSDTRSPGDPPGDGGDTGPGPSQDSGQGSSQKEIREGNTVIRPQSWCGPTRRELVAVSEYGVLSAGWCVPGV